jgi:hypothetical protein
VPAAPQTTGNPTGDWRNRVAGTPRNPDWRNRHQTDGLHDWRNHQNDANIDWHNRTGSGNRDWRDHGGGHGGWHHDWDRHSHHCDWWRSRYSRFAFFGGGYYYWDAGFWYPAYGYDPSYTTYAYDAPIYGYNDQSPADVMVSVQQELARRGFYYGAIDGTYGPLTRSALLNYQQSVGLASTGVLDQPTLASLGFD